jgi:hypothetical protein
MTQSMIGFVVGFAVLIVIALVAGHRHRQEHPGEIGAGTRIRQWLDTHHMHWPHRRN